MYFTCFLHVKEGSSFIIDIIWAMNFPIRTEIFTRALKCTKSNKHILLSFTEITKPYQSVPDGQRSCRP